MTVQIPTAPPAVGGPAGPAATRPPLVRPARWACPQCGHALDHSPTCPHNNQLHASCCWSCHLETR